MIYFVLTNRWLETTRRPQEDVEVTETKKKKRNQRKSIAKKIPPAPMLSWVVEVAIVTLVVGPFWNTFSTDQAKTKSVVDVAVGILVVADVSGTILCCRSTGPHDPDPVGRTFLERLDSTDHVTDCCCRGGGGPGGDAHHEVLDRTFWNVQPVRHGQLPLLFAHHRPLSQDRRRLDYGLWPTAQRPALARYVFDSSFLFVLASPFPFFYHPSFGDRSHLARGRNDVAAVRGTHLETGLQHR